jgi:hypothetical protein
MATRKVYSFRKFDIAKGEHVISKTKATPEFIKTIAQGEIIAGTEMEVDENLLTAEGQVKVSQQRLRPVE